MIPEKVAEIKNFCSVHGERLLSKCSVNQAYLGMRGVKCMTWETSILDPQKGIRFRNYTIPQVRELLVHNSMEPVPEALLWLLMTGEIPTHDQIDALSAELSMRARLPDNVNDILKILARSNAHPMNQLVSAVMALQVNSHFARMYHEGNLRKNEYWSIAFEDALDLIACLPNIAASIYQNTFKGGINLPPQDSSLDYSANFARKLGHTSSEFDEMLRLYLVIHADHEGGNASAHTSHIVGSTLTDPYMAYAAGMCALAGPLHGLANQEVLHWILNFQKKFKGTDPTLEDIRNTLWDTLNAGQVVPGYGHAVLRDVDPRYVAQRDFALKHMPDDPIFKLVSKIFQVAPDVLTKHGKTKNPWPNVDAHSGCLLLHYGIKEYSYYTVLFGVSRALGILSSLVWSRALGLPIERPKSVTTDWILNNINDQTPSV